jgi:hypothetical protein
MSKKDTRKPFASLQSHVESPKADGGLVTLAAPAVAAAKHLWDAHKDAQAEVNPGNPLRFSVLRCDRKESGHDLYVLCLNRGQHGVYLERFVLMEPTLGAVSSAVTLHPNTVYSPNMRGDAEKAPALPLLLPCNARRSTKTQGSPAGSSLRLSVSTGLFRRWI